MLISIDWIKDFVKLPELSPKELGIQFTMASAEVENVIEQGQHLDAVRVAEIVSIEKHPEADKLNLVTFNFGGKENKRVVCGANNVKVGLKTLYAPIGITLPNGMTLEPKKIRGILSEGMLCSEAELGYSDRSAGIMELPASDVVGTTLKDLKNEKGDILLDVDNKSLTHRPDMWGHFGIAREFSAIFNSPFINKFDQNWTEGLKKNFNSLKSPIIPKIHGDCSALGYYGLSLSNVKVAESPDWMKSRLTAVGLRPINNIVDISNYVMLELGIPLHIFDRDLMEGSEINIERLKGAKKFTTLDQVERDLNNSDTVISDAKKPLVLAGIMGGLNSGVSDSTSNIFIEVANWKAADVRKTSTRLGLRTDSSQRYEKTLDTELLERTLLRALELVLELSPDAKVIGKMEYDGMDLSAVSALSVSTSVEKISNVLGIEISSERIHEILMALDFSIVDNSGTLTIGVPSYRATKDIENEADIIEEIGRVIGYDNITPLSPKLDIEPVKLSPEKILHRKFQDFLVNHGQCFEIMTYPMVGNKLLDKAGWRRENEVKVINGLSKDAEIMRPSLVPSLLNVAALNVKNLEEFKVFELGRSYKREKKEFSKDRNTLGIMFYHKSEPQFLELVNVLKRALRFTSVPVDFIKPNPKYANPNVDSNWKGLHPYEYFDLKVMGKLHGFVTSLHPILGREFKIKGHLSMAILDLSSFEKRPMKEKIKYNPLSKFPGSTFDWTVLVDRDQEVGEILSQSKKIKLKELKSLKIVDVFFQEDKKSVTLRANFCDTTQTLSGEFIEMATNKLIKVFEDGGYPLKS
ncbi:MAG: phenylalanine--tRNA ligase subunit beta [Bacteriovoracaceae bacterium]|jgi:phenylalanyl-tRNA synthetase beta chain|nr:phenylalanine--tRNA ligase subunit beta [Bacteriovoracaceae bacterium]